MNIYGFQKMTLLDFPNKVACTVFTGGCNLRCPFCHNALLVTKLDQSEKISEREVLSYLEKRAGILDGVCITGGEPLLQEDISEFIAKIKALGYAVKLDTNGCFPDKLKQLVENKLVDYVAVDIKNCKEKYAKTVGIADFDVSAVEESVRFLQGGKVDYEFRTTVVEQFHTVEDIDEIGRWIKGAPRYFLQAFQDSGNLISDGLSAVSFENMELMKHTAEQYVQNVEIRGI